MLRKFSIDFAIFSMLVDAVLVTLALRLAILLRPWLGEHLSFARTITVPVEVELVLYPFFAAAWVVMLLLFSVYDGRRNFRITDELGSLIGASLLATVLLAGVLYLTFREYSRIMFLSFALITFLMLTGIRLLYRLAFRRLYRNDLIARKVLILGAGPVGQKIAEQIACRPNANIKLAGFLDDDPLKANDPLVLGSIDKTVEVILREKIEDVIFALPSRVWSRISALIGQLHELPIKVWVAPDYYTLALYRARVEEFSGIPLIDLRAPALDEYQRMVKRIFDLSLTILALPVSLPFMALLALWVKLDSPGPVIFRQTRVGENGRLFTMYKFRTMVEGAEKLHHIIEDVDEQGKIHQDKRRPDPRVTRAGEFLRRTSLDELPQLYNIFRGEMSLVGPRPEMPYMVEQYEPWQRRRFAVPQGVTGWWQVNGRSDKPMYLNTEDDLYYVQHYSLWLDILILFRTLVVVLKRKGAY